MSEANVSKVDNVGDNPHNTCTMYKVELPFRDKLYPFDTTEQPINIIHVHAHKMNFPNKATIGKNLSVIDIEIHAEGKYLSSEQSFFIYNSIVILTLVLRS